MKYAIMSLLFIYASGVLSKGKVKNDEGMARNTEKWQGFGERQKERCWEEKLLPIQPDTWKKFCGKEWKFSCETKGMYC